MEKINDKSRIQQREVIIREFDNELEFDATMWKITVPKNESIEFFSAWMNGDLKENSNFDNRIPKIIKDLKDDETN